MNVSKMFEDTSESAEPTFTRPKEMAASDRTSMLSVKVHSHGYDQ